MKGGEVGELDSLVLFDECNKELQLLGGGYTGESKLSSVETRGS